MSTRCQAEVNQVSGTKALVVLLAAVAAAHAFVAMRQQLPFTLPHDAEDTQAEGIAQALVTTVLGLTIAIPLLFLHNLLASRSRTLIQILDQETAGLIAQGSGAGEAA